MRTLGQFGTRCSCVAADYWRAASRPLSSCVFVAPMLLAYEGGQWWLGPRSFRNGADVWLRQSLECCGFSQYFLLPLLTCAILLAWHHVRRDAWQLRYAALHGMLIESALFGVILLLAAQIQSSLFAARGDWPLMRWSSEPSEVGRLLSYLGAGVYEELLFRLMLLPVLYVVLRGAGASQRGSWVGAVVAGSLLFAAAHYQLTWDWGIFRLGSAAGEPFAWCTFAFRTLAGIFFSLLFLYRGFGVAAGAHALYDVLVAA